MRRARPLLERFEEKFTRGEAWECWNWIAGANEQGRGMFKVSRFGQNGGTLPAPRVAYQLYKGAIPDGFVVMHSCDNPRCVNPAHLSVGTLSENTRDMINKRRAGWQRRLEAA